MRLVALGYNFQNQGFVSSFQCASPTLKIKWGFFAENNGDCEQLSGNRDFSNLNLLPISSLHK